MRERYESMQTSDGLAWIKSSSIPESREVDAVVFDCDGVLVNSQRSYDATIVEVTKRILSELVGISTARNDYLVKLVRQLRKTGGFNNDWDSTYALILFSILALPERENRRLSQEELPDGSQKSRRVSSKRLGTVVDEFCSTPIGTRIGYAAVNSYLHTARLTNNSRALIGTVQQKLGYPGSPPRSLLSTLFDEVYHGPQLYQSMYGAEARHYKGRGFIENERLLIRMGDLRILGKLLGRGRLAIVTGRPYLAAKYVLRKMMRYFDRNASVFIGDIDVYPELASRLAKLRKPGGRSMVHVQRTLSSEMLLYVGDSAEDANLVENARRMKVPVLFAGIYGTERENGEQLRFFKDREADLILPTVRVLPALLRSVKYENR